jgi:hypothetical protein
METRWTPEGPQWNLGNWFGHPRTGWNMDESAGKANFELDMCIDKDGKSVRRKPLWEDVHPHKKFPSEAPLTTDFIIFGCLIQSHITNFTGKASDDMLTVKEKVDVFVGDTVTGQGIPANTTIISRYGPLTYFLSNKATFDWVNCVAVCKRLWLYAYKGLSEPDKNKQIRNNQWYCTEPIPQINKDYIQIHPFVPYIGTWTDAENPTDAGKWATQYNRFIYLKEDDPQIKGRNPYDNYDFFGWKLKPSP